MKRPLTRHQRKLIRTWFLSDQGQRFRDSPALETDDVVRFGLAEVMATQRVMRVSGADAFRLGMILHHAGSAQKARAVAREGVRGHPKGLWLVCAIVDRQLLDRGLPQRSGTQFRVDPLSHEWTIREPG